MQEQNVCEKIGVPLKSTKKIKTWMGNLTGNVDKKATETYKTDETKKISGKCWDKKYKTTQEKMTIKLQEINQKVLAKEGRLKRC